MKKSLKRRLIGWTAAAVSISLLYAWGFTMETVSYRTESSKISADAGNIRIVFISDLHSCRYGGRDQSGLMKAVDKQSPDIVLFGGDLIDHKGDFEDALTLMKLVQEKYPCAYTPGNHEMMRSDLQDFYSLVQEQTGVPILLGDCADFTVRGQRISVYGVIDSIEYGRDGTQLENCYEKLDGSVYNILLAHQPEQISRYLESPGEAAFDLVLSGHAHGGQWRIPGVLEQGLYAPNQGIFPDRTAGRFDEGGTVQIVSRGLARPLRMIFVPRIFNRPELSVIDLTSES